MTIRIARGVPRGLSRRRFLSTAAVTGAGALGTIAMPYLSRAADRPQITHGVQSGDVGADDGVVWARAAPSAGMQFFGHVKIDGASGQMTVTLRDRADVALWSTTLDPRLG